MRNTLKKCRGIGKAQGFSGCGTMQLVRTYGLGHSCGCYYKWLRETLEGQKKVSQATLKAKKTVIKKKAKADREKKQSYSIDQKLNEAIQLIARLIDFGQPCLARGYAASSYDGGHLYSKGSNASLRWNLHNVHAQCSKSNQSLKEDGLMWQGLKRVYGENYFEYVQSFKQLSYSGIKLIDKKHALEQTKQIIKHLKGSAQVYTNLERIELRNIINQKLNLYPINYCVFS